MISVENERNFENMLFADASALPPPQDTVTPWHTAMHYILWGLGLTTITLRFLNLDVILTAVGAALLVLGFRILRRENASLRWGFRLSLAALAVRSVCFSRQRAAQTAHLAHGMAVLRRRKMRRLARVFSFNQCIHKGS